MSNAINETTFNHSHNTTTLCLQANFKQTEAGVIPSDWTAKQLKDVFALKNGYSFKGEFFSNDGPIVLTPGNFKLEGGLYFETRNTKRYCAEYPKGYEFEKGDLVVVMTDLTPDCNLLGKPAFVDFDEKILHNQRIGKITQLLKNWEPRFLYYTLLSPAYLSNVKSAATGSTVRHTSPSTIASTWIAEPPILEQTAIANALSDVDALIQELEKLIAKKQAIKTATMQQLLTGRTRLPQFAHHPDGRKKGYKSSELGEIPEDWEVCEFGSLLQEFRNGYAFSADGYEQTGIPIITMAQIGLSGCFQFDIAKVNKWDMNQLDKLKEFWVQNGDLLIAMTDVTPDKNLIGQMTIAKLDCVAFLNQRVGLLRMRTGVADATFFSFLSCLPVWKQYCRGVASLGVQANIGTTDIRKAKVYCPPIGEQAAITRILSDMDSEIQAQQHRLDKTRQIKQGMMQELLTGRIRLVQSLNEVMHE